MLQETFVISREFAIQTAAMDKELSNSNTPLNFGFASEFKKWQSVLI